MKIFKACFLIQFFNTFYLKILQQQHLFLFLLNLKERKKLRQTQKQTMNSLIRAIYVKMPLSILKLTSKTFFMITITAKYQLQKNHPSCQKYQCHHLFIFSFVISIDRNMRFLRSIVWMLFSKKIYQKEYFVIFLFLCSFEIHYIKITA